MDRNAWFYLKKLLKVYRHFTVNFFLLFIHFYKIILFLYYIKCHLLLIHIRIYYIPLKVKMLGLPMVRSTVLTSILILKTVL